MSIEDILYDDMKHRHEVEILRQAYEAQAQLSLLNALMRKGSSRRNRYHGRLFCGPEINLEELEAALRQHVSELESWAKARV